MKQVPRVIKETSSTVHQTGNLEHIPFKFQARWVEAGQASQRTAHPGKLPQTTKNVDQHGSCNRVARCHGHLRGKPKHPRPQKAIVTSLCICPYMCVCICMTNVTSACAYVSTCLYTIIYVRFMSTCLYTTMYVWFMSTCESTCACACEGHVYVKTWTHLTLMMTLMHIGKSLAKLDW